MTLLLAGCGDDDGDSGSAGTDTAATDTSATDTTGAGGGGTAGMANPASVFCEQQDGTVEIVTAADGSQSGLCKLADGTEVDEWQYYREFHTDGEGAELANPAAVYCEEQGGTTSGDEPMCELPDGQVVDAWDYYRAQTAGTPGDGSATPTTAAGASTTVAPVAGAGGYYGG